MMKNNFITTVFTFAFLIWTSSNITLAQVACNGSMTIDETEGYTSASPLTIGDGTSGSIYVCITINNLTPAGGGGTNPDAFRIGETDGTIIATLFPTSATTC